MLTLATGRPSSAARPTRGREGFTLVELIVVIAIIGVMISLAPLAFRPSIEDEVEREARRLGLLIESASDFAVLRAEEYGLLVDDDTYAFLRLGENGWEPLPDRAFAEHRLPEFAEIELLTDGAAAELPDVQDNELPPPQVLILSNADVSAFEILLSPVDQDDGRWRLRLDERGAVALEEVEP